MIVSSARLTARSVTASATTSLAMNAHGTQRSVPASSVLPEGPHAGCGTLQASHPPSARTEIPIAMNPNVRLEAVVSDARAVSARRAGRWSDSSAAERAREDGWRRSRKQTSDWRLERAKAGSEGRTLLA
jgi:hypothetical protein